MTSPPESGEERPQSGLSIVVRIVGLWIVLPLALMLLIKMLVQ
jgi:hypothetical protein